MPCNLPFWPEGEAPVTIVPININTVQFPLPSAKRVYALGKAVGEAIAAWDSDKTVAVLASGGLSHQLDGERAGFINKEFDVGHGLEAAVRMVGEARDVVVRVLAAEGI